MIHGAMIRGIIGGGVAVWLCLCCCVALLRYHEVLLRRHEAWSHELSLCCCVAMPLLLCCFVALGGVAGVLCSRVVLQMLVLLWFLRVVVCIFI